MAVRRYSLTIPTTLPCGFEKATKVTMWGITVTGTTVFPPIEVTFAKGAFPLDSLFQPSAKRDRFKKG